MFFNFFKKKLATPSRDFSKFFIESKASEKKKVLKEITTYGELSSAQAVSSYILQNLEAKSIDFLLSDSYALNT